MNLSKPNTPWICLVVIAMLLVTCQPAQQEVQQQPPNILIILADDLGYSDIGCYGGEINTPNLDRLANNGLRFRNFYNAARCCPTRASLLTGLYPHQAGMGGMVTDVSKPLSPPGPYQGYLNDSSATMAEVLKGAGYKTYMSGKWHVGEHPEHWPTKRGFDRYFGLISGASSYYEVIKDQPRVRQMALDDQIWEPPSEGFYMTDAITDYALDFLEKHVAEQKDQPFFTYLAYTAPHWPLHALPEDIERYEGKYDQGWEPVRQQRFQKMKEIGLIDQTYRLSEIPNTIPDWDTLSNQQEWSRRMEVHAAMVDRMDQGIGKVISLLEESGNLENTLILFLSDNGGSSENITARNLNDPSVLIGEQGSYAAFREPWANASNTPYRKYKRWTHEGGIKTPFIMHWPEAIKSQGSIVSGYGHIIDIMTTALQLSRAEYSDNSKSLAGKSLDWAWQGASSYDKDRVLYWEHFGHRAIRKGPWKLVSALPDNQWELYNLDEDPVELNDLSEDYPEKVEELDELHQEWGAEIGIRQE